MWGRGEREWVEGDEVSKPWLVPDPRECSGSRVGYVEGPESHRCQSAAIPQGDPAAPQEPLQAQAACFLDISSRTFAFQELFCLE